MKKKYTRFISFLLTLVIIALCFPANIIATELEEQTLQPEILEEERKIVELEALREENVKHFSLPDGTYEAIAYGQAVHRKDSEGVWQDINNDLSLTTVGTKQLYTTADMRVSYAKDFSANGELLTLSENGYYISMAMLVNDDFNISADDTASRITTVTNSSLQRQEEYDTLDEAAEIDNKSTIVYSNVINNTDIEYITVGNDIKENIIVKSRADSYEYAFELRLIGLSAALAEEGYISLSDSESGEQKYLIPAPYMYDANYEYSNDVAYELIEIGDGRYLLTVTANADWINSEERAFPVKIDPTIRQDRIAYDTFISASDTDENYGDYPYMLVSAPSASEAHALIRITIPSLPEDASFYAASLQLSYYYEGVTSENMTAGAYEISEYWSENIVTYNNIPDYNTDALGVTTLITTPEGSQSNPERATFSITNAVRDWLDDPSSNYGVLIKYLLGENTQVYFCSYESGNNYGLISISYSHTIPDGVYALRSKFSSNRWMTVESNSVGAHIQQTASSTSPVTNFDTSKLFKITKDIGMKYIVRTMLDNDLGLQISGTQVLTQEIPLLDDDVPSSKTFYLEWNGSGFSLEAPGTGKVIYISSLSTANLTTGSKSSVGESTKASWELVPCELPTLTLDVRYDNGFTQRYTDWEDRVYQGTARMQEKFLIDFGLWINILEPDQFTSYADSCEEAGTDIDALCDCPSKDGCINAEFGKADDEDLYHHKNIINVAYHLPEKRASADYRVAFIGHKMCNQHDHDGELGHLGLHFPGTDILLICGSYDNTTIDEQTTALVHEVGHIYEPENDHYGDTAKETTDSINEKYHTSNFNRKCIYGEDNDLDEVIEDIVICAGCQNLIRQGILSQQ